jgi:hypothetical protein
MDECDISALSGDALRFAFFTSLNPGAVCKGAGPLVTVSDEGNIKIYLCDIGLPSIELVDPAAQKVMALDIFQRRTATFEAIDNNLSMFCTINGATGLGANYVESGMRAYLLSLEKAKKQT